MILQLSAILGAVGSTLLETGLGIGRQFLERELSRGARREQRDLIRARAMATGASSFVAAQPTGALSAPFVQTPVRFASTSGLAGLERPGFLDVEATRQRNGVSRGFPGGAFGGGFSGRGGATSNGTGRFTFDNREGCVRPSLPGEKPTHRIDPQTGDFVKVKPRRINLLNLTAFKRAERRVDGLTKICRTLFKEERRKTTGTVQRKKRRRKR